MSREGVRRQGPDVAGTTGLGPTLKTAMSSIAGRHGGVPPQWENRTGARGGWRGALRGLTRWLCGLAGCDGDGGKGI